VALVLSAAGPVQAQAVGRGTPVSVQVGNPESAPVPVRDVEHPARDPYQAAVTVDLANGDLTKQGTLDAVPAGKRLVVEALYVNALLPASQLAAVFFVQAPVVTVPVPLTFTGAFPSGESFVGAQATRLYVSAGAPFTTSVVRTSSAGAASVRFLAVGYLVDVP
jgi:hypothetical protein